MPDMTPVANQVIPPDPTKGINTFSGILGLKQQQQALQLGQQKLAVGQTEVQQSQQKNTELQNLSLFTQGAIKSGKYQLPDGSPDVQSFTKDAMGIAPTYGQEFIGHAASNFKEAIGARQSLQNLGEGQAQSISKRLIDFSNLPRDQATHEQWANTVEAVRSVSSDRGYQRMIDNALTGMDRNDLQGSAARLASTLGGVTSRAPATQQLGGQTLTGTQTGFGPGQGVFNPSGQVATAGVPASRQLAPSGEIITFPATASNISGGGAASVTAGHTGGGGGARPAPQPNSKLPAMVRPPSNAPTADQEQYKSRIKQLGDEYGSISTAANDPQNGVQATRYRNQRILDLAPHSGTGPHMGSLNTVISRLPGRTGDDYQDIAHYTAQNSAALAKTMGVPNTNMGAETAAAAAGNVERNPGTLMEITRANDALNTGFDLYNRGLAKVTNNGSDMSRAASYKQTFGQNVDINALRWADAHRRGDQEEIQSIAQKFGKDGIAKFQQKLKTLKSLAEVGDLP